jgi:two-component system phosphate regulon sensor histidine kinase PhoR
LNPQNVSILSALARNTRRVDFVWAFLAVFAAVAGVAMFDSLGGRAASLAIALVILAVRFFGDAGRFDGGLEGVVEAAPQRLSLATAEALIERLPDPLILLDSEGKIQFANSASHALIGQPAGRRHISAALRAPGVLEAVRLVLGGAPAHSVEYVIPVPVERHILAYVAPIPLRIGEGGTVGQGAILVLHELTAQKRLEQMRADFVANASHELRTPLASLSGYVDTLRGHARDDAPARERFLEIMAEQAGRMRRLIEDLLSLSRIELNEHVRPENEVKLADVTRDVLDALAPQAAARLVTVTSEIAPDMPPVSGERDELIQVVQNLVDNAIKYGASGRRILVRVGCAEPSEGEARRGRANFVAVQDFGEGIAREHLPRLTERFYRIDVQRSRQTGGTGLGLAIVKHIVNRHRGWMSIESQPGEGATFTVFLPWADSVPALRLVPSTPQPNESAA